MRRLSLSILVVVGVGLIVAPLSMSMFSRTSDGEQTVNTFRPLMQPASVRTTADYYYDVFVKLRPIAETMTPQTIAKFTAYMEGFAGMQADGQKLVPALAQAMNTTPAQVQQMLASQFPSMAQMLASLPQMEKDFTALMGMMAANVDTFRRVPPGLDHYKPLVDVMQANVGNYASIDAMPRFSLFPWFFVIPGVLIVLAAAYLLVGDVRPDLVWPKLGPKPPSTPQPLAH
jgi:hypothetical protein